MAKFTDAFGSDWLVEINVSQVRRVRDTLGLDLCDAVGGDFLQRLSQDPVLLCDCLYVLCRDQAQERGVSDERFGEGLYGDAVADAAHALLDALVNFSRSPRERAALARIMLGMQEANEKAWNQADKKLDDLLSDKGLDQAVSEAMASGKSSGSAPESSDSTPAP